GEARGAGGADADRDGYVPGDGPPVVRADGDAQSFELAGGVGQRGAGEDQDELLAAEPGGGSGGQILFQQVGDGDQHPVASVVGQRVVDLFEMVQVDHGDGERGAGRGGLVDQGGQVLVDVTPVAQAGERVTAGLFAEAFGVLVRLGGLEH